MGAYFRLLLLSCILGIVFGATVKREASTTAAPLVDLNQLKHRMDQFQGCVDQHLAKVVGDVQTHQLDPVLNIIGDQVSRLTKAFDALTAAKTTRSPLDDDDD